MTHQGAARDAASVYFSPTIKRTDIIVCFAAYNLTVSILSIVLSLFSDLFQMYRFSLPTALVVRVQQSIGCVCLCFCVWTVPFELNNL